MRKDTNGFFYENIPGVEMLKRLREFNEMLINFNSFFKNYFKDYTYSIPLICEIYKRIDQRADYYLFFHSDPKNRMEMTQTKEIALMAYWLIKYKPLTLPVNKASTLFINKNCTINEYFAAYLIFSYALKTSPRKDIRSYFRQKNLDVLIYSFMHRDISKEAMICFVDSLLNIAEN